MKFFLGYNDIFQLHKWTPLNVILENKGKTTHGSLEVVTTSGSEYLNNVHSTTYSMEAELPTNARKLYSFTIRLHSFTYPLVLQLKERGKVILRRELNLRNHYTEDQLVLVLSERVSLDFLSIFPEKVKPIYPRAEFLPETWYGYEGVEMVIIHGSTLKRLREKQFTALKEWVQRGGYCVISGNINFGAYLDSRMGELIPVRILGLKELSELHSLEKFCEEKLIVSDPFLILESRPSHGQTILSEGSLPIIVQRAIGLGMVLFLAFDYDMYPFSEWKGRFSLWKKILALKPGSGVVARKLDNYKLLSSMITKTSARFPSHILLTIFMGVYLLWVFRLFRHIRKNKPERGKALICLAASGIVFSILSYYIFFYQIKQHDPLLNGYAHLNLLDKKRIASIKYLLGLYSLRGGSFQIVFDNQKHPISPVAAKVAGKERPFDFELKDSVEGQRVLVQMDRWSGRFFEIDARISFPLGGEASMDRQGLTVSIENLTAHTIRDCKLYFDNRLFAVGMIMPDSKATIKLPEQTIRETKELTIDAIERLSAKMSSGFSTSPTDKMSIDLIKEGLKRIHSHRPYGKDVAIFLGRIDSDVIPTRLIGFNGHLRKVALLELEMRVNSGEI